MVTSALALIALAGSQHPSGMVRLPGGEFPMGSNNVPDASPAHRVSLDPFWIDANEVTNAQFARFVGVTGYVTVAERRPTVAQVPRADPKLLVPGSTVFSPPKVVSSLNDPNAWWAFVPGANWRHPLGPSSSISGKQNYPVVQIAYEDAAAYAKWAGKRLPTEAEFEYAARGGLVGKQYAWGDDPQPNGKWPANIFQGNFPIKDTGEDGYKGLAPVRSFPPNGFGLYDMAGNVWEWCSDLYRPDTYARLASRGSTHNPQGPSDSFDPDEPGAVKRVQRGGSFLCSAQYCCGYAVAVRNKCEVATATNHAGFRCVISATNARMNSDVSANR